VPIHPDGYAAFDATIMVHDGERLPLTAQFRLHCFSAADDERLGGG